MENGREKKTKRKQFSRMLAHFIKEICKKSVEWVCYQTRPESLKQKTNFRTYRGEWCIFQYNIVQVSALGKCVFTCWQDTAENMLQTVCATVCQTDCAGVVQEKRKKKNCFHFHFFSLLYFNNNKKYRYFFKEFLMKREDAWMSRPYSDWTTMSCKFDAHE